MANLRNKEACRKYRNSHLDEIRSKAREASRLYRLKYPEKVKKAISEWRKANITHLREYSRNRYRISDKEQLSFRRRQYYSENSDKFRSYFSRVNPRFTNAKSSSRRRGLEWSIQKSEFKEFLTKKCHYCEGSLSPTGIGLDRLDNSKGYTISNVVPCCGDCNKVRSNILTHDEMVIVMKSLKEYRLSKILEGVQIV